ncbi:hypothetical protein F5X99DRAFT_417174 [Biscogniauxia marginata]|nr:hypothetical protein F5X99DRAFT_417174 [Biscogniauxia marginata]
MPVTNLVWLTSSSATFTDEDKAAMERALGAQAEWVARNVPSAPRGRDARGVGLFRQVEDPRVVLETAHWESTEQHLAWLASDEYKASSAALVPHFLLDQIEYFHLDVDVFSGDGDGDGDGDGKVPLLKSPVVSVGRVTVAADRKEDLAKAWEGGKGVLEAFAKPHVVRSGWRKQKADPDTEESVFFIGWPAVERHAELAKTEDFVKYATPLLSFAKTNDVKHYRRVL